MQVLVNTRRGVTDGLDGVIVVHNSAGTKSSRKVPAGCLIYKKPRSFQSSTGKSRELIPHV